MGGRDGAKTRPALACLHGHHANIGHLDRLFPAAAVEVVHYVDPGLLRRVAADPSFSAAAQADRVASQLDWIAADGCDAIAVTCTAYAALAGESAGAGGTPVVAIDAPLFAELAARDQPALLAFTNPATIGPTLGRLARVLGDAAPPARPVLIPDAFRFVMDGRAAEYEERVAVGLRAMSESAGGSIVVAAQLSMVGAARRVREETGAEILDPLAPLASRLAAVLGVADVGHCR